jgi:kinesin family protein C1
MSIAKLNATIVDLEARIGALKAAREDREQLLLNTQQQVDNERQMQGPLRERIADLERRLHAAETHRRRLHNQVLELKGNIRVFCRVRPLLDDEKLMPEQSLSDSYQFSRPSDADPLHYYHSGSGNGGEEGETLTVLQDTESVTGQSRTKTSEFAFDRVFGPDSTQPDVFAEIADLVQSSLDGYRVCIFAYGQTGSGKTYTMEGPSLKDHIGDAKSDDGDGEEGEEGGMIPRAARQLFDTAHRLATERKWSFAFEASYLEIYNETIRDLLQPLDASNNGQKGADDLDIKHISGRTVVPGLTVVPVSSKEQLLDLLRMAARNRSVGGTLCNERSSRSHAVFTLSITSVNKVTQERLEGVLNLVDLAGSERLSSSQSTGERLKETQHINRSLSALGDVIAALQDSSYSANASKTGSNHANHHVPYRNSKLTFLLQPSLGGASSKTLMFVNVNPSPASVPESLCSLRFASKVRACHIGTAHKNLVPQGGGK